MTAELEFLRAVRRANVEKVKALLAEEPSLCNARDPYTGGFPLSTAVQYGMADLVQVLLDHGADPFFRKNNGESATQVAPLGNPEDVQKCIEMVKKKLETMDTPEWLKLEERLLVLSRKGDHEGIRKLFEQHPNINVNARDRYNGSTPLHAACKSGSIDTVSLLLVNGADINCRERKSKRTPLDVAIFVQGYTSEEQALEMITEKYAIQSPSGNKARTYSEIAKLDPRCNVIVFLAGRSFGADLQFLLEVESMHADFNGIYLPYVVKECMRIGMRLPAEEGILRIPPPQSELWKYLEQFNSLSNRPRFPDTVERNVPDKILTRFIRELPSPLLSHAFIVELCASENLPKPTLKLLELRRDQPRPERDLLCATLGYFRHILAQEKVTKMGLDAMSVVLAPVYYPPCIEENCIREATLAVKMLLEKPKFLKASKWETVTKKSKILEK